MPDLTSAYANRHAWALEKSRHLLAAALRKDTSAEAREVEKLPKEKIPAHIVSLILEKADPAHNKGMTAWLVGQYAQGSLRLEDLGTAHETLTMFRRYAQRLEPTHRDLGQYSNLAAVWEAVIAFAQAEEQHISGKAQKALDRDKAYAESRILRQDEDGFTIAVPLTEFAAKWWGRGTRWCTAAEKDNQFWHYHKDAPLIVVVIPELKEKGKFQIWATKEIVQFMDSADIAVSEFLMKQYWPRFEPVISLALQQNGLALEHVPAVLCTEELYRIAVAQNGWALGWVPQKLRTEDMCRIAVAQKGNALGYVPDALRTSEVCRIAVAQNGQALAYVPEDLRTAELCSIAVAQDRWALRYVPEKLQTKELCRISVARHGQSLEYVPKDLRTEKIYRIAVAQNGLALEHVPKKLRTKEMCRVAVAQNGMALRYVPQNRRTKEIYRIAMAQNGGALYDVPEKRRTAELCRIALGSNGMALRYVPKKLRTEDMCKIAVRQNAHALESVPKPLRTPDLCEIALRLDKSVIWFVPEQLRPAMRHLLSPPPPAVAWSADLLEQLFEILTPSQSPKSLELRHA